MIRAMTILTVAFSIGAAISGNAARADLTTGAAPPASTASAAIKVADANDDFKNCRVLSGDAAITACDRAIASGRFSGRALAEAYTDRCVERVQKSEFDRALADCNEATRIDPTLGLAYVHKARALLGKKDAGNALAAANEGIRLLPNDAYALAIRGDVQAVLGQRDAARADYNKALDSNPSAAARQVAQTGLAFLLLGSAPGGGNVSIGVDSEAKKCRELSGDAAIRACDLAIASGQFSGKALALLYSNRCAEWVTKSDYDRAVADCSEAIDGDPQEGFARANKARALLGKKDANAALVEANEAVRLMPGQPLAFAVRGEAKRALGRIDLAKADYDKAMGLNPRGLVLQMAQTGLAALASAASAIASGDLKQCRELTGEPGIAACGRVIAVGKSAGSEILAEAYSRRGGEYHDKGAFDLALADLNQAAELNPKLRSAYVNRGFVYLAKKDHARAIADYSEAIRLAPGFFVGYLNRANVYHELGDHDHAIADLSEAIRLKPDEAGAYFNRAGEYSGKGDKDRAIADYGEAIRIDPRKAQFWNARGFAYFDKNDYDRAIADLTESLKLAPNILDVINTRGRAYLGKQDFDRAIADFSAAITLAPQQAYLRNNRGLAYLGKPDYERAIADFAEAIKRDANQAVYFSNRCRAELGKKDNAGALADCNEAIRLSPNFVYATALRGDALRALGRREEAIADYRKAVSANPDADTINIAVPGLKALGIDVIVGDDDYVTCVNGEREATIAACGRAIASGKYTGHELAILYKERGYAFAYGDKAELDRALADQNEAIRLDPKYVDAFNARGDAYFKKGDIDLALADFGEAIRLDPNSSLAFANRATAYLRKDDRPRAIADYSEAIRLNPGNERALRGRAFTYASERDYDRALADYSEVLRLDPDDANIRKDRGLVYLYQHDYDHAIADFTECIRLSPQTSVFINSRGVAYLAKQDYEQALADFDQALAIDPSFGMAYLNRARALLAKGEVSRALADTTKANPFVSTDSAYLARVYGDVLKAIGRHGEAITQYNKALTLNPDEDTRSDVIAALTELGAPPSAAMADANYANCIGLLGDPAIAACDRVISSGTFAGKDLALAFSSRGRSFAVKREDDRALSDYTEAIRLDASLAAAFRRRGDVYFRREDYERAIADYGEAMRLDPRDPVNAIDRADAYVMARDYDRAIADYNTAIGLNRNNPDAFNGRGLAYAGKRDYEHALADYNEALRLGPDDVLITGNRSEVYYLTGDFDRALADIATVIKSNPENPGIWHGKKARALLAKQDTAAALSAADEAVRLEPASSFAFAIRADVLRALGRRDEAILEYSRALSLGPDSDTKLAIDAGFKALGAQALTVFEDAKKCSGSSDDDGVAACDRAIMSANLSGKDLAAVFVARGNSFYDRKIFDRAIADFSEAIRLAPSSADAYLRRGAGYYYKRDYAHAIADYSEAIKLDAGKPYLFFNRANSYFASQDYDRAIADFSEAVRLDPKYVAAFDSRASAYSRKGDYERAIADYDQIITLKPDDADAFTDRGIAHNSKGDYDRAIADFDRALQLDPNSIYPVNGRGLALLNKGENDRAIADLDRAIAINPKYALAYANRARALLQNKEPDRALIDANKGVELSPNNAYTNRVVGDVLSALGRTDEARGVYAQALTLEPDVETLKAVQDALKALGAVPAPAISQADIQLCDISTTEAGLAACGRLIASGKLSGEDLGHTYYSRAETYRRTGRNEPAIADYDQAIKLGFENEYVLFGRAKAQQSLGHRAEAIADYNKALTMRPDAQERAAVEQELLGLATMAAAPTDLAADFRSCARASGDETIAACSRAIMSGQFTGKDLITLYQNRALAYRGKGDSSNALADADEARRLREAAR